MKLRLPPHCYITLYSRSSLARVGVTVVGGVVDNDFRGEIRAILRNSNGEPVSFKKGDKICQGIFDFKNQVEFYATRVEEDTERGKRGFGLSGR